MDNKIHHEWLNSPLRLFFTVRKRSFLTTVSKKLDLSSPTTRPDAHFRPALPRWLEKSDSNTTNHGEPALCAHPDPRRVLVIGGGDGGISGGA